MAKSKVEPAKRGRPSSYDKEFHPQNFIDLSKAGKNVTQISCEWDISRDTIYEWEKTHKEFKDAFKRGKELLEAWWIDKGIKAMQGEVTCNLGYYVWLTKNILNWSDKERDKDGNEKPTQIKVNISKYVPPRN